MTLVTFGYVYWYLIADLMQEICYNVDPIIIELSYAFFFICYPFVIRRTYECPVCAFIIKDDPELLVNIVSVKRFCEQQMMLAAFVKQ